MLCGKCHEREALVHITNIKMSPIDEPIGEEDYYLCEVCTRSNPVANTGLKYGADVIEEKLRVVSVSDNYIHVRLVRTETDPSPTVWTLVRERVPKEKALVGQEFGITCTPQELEFLMGNRETL